MRNVTTLAPVTVDAILVDLDECALARRVASTDKVRHADIVDPVDGEHTWFDATTGSAVVVPERHVQSFRAYVASRGMVLDMPVGAFRTIGFTLEGRFDTYFERLSAVVNG